MRAHSRRPRSGERGATAIIVAIVLAALCGFAALSLDVGHLFAVRGELQNGADAAALAGAKRLNGREDELSGAKGDATNFARNHPTDRWDVEPTTVQLGAWIPPSASCPSGSAQAGATGADGYRFCAIPGTSEADAANINAVRVVTQRVGTPGGTGGGAVELAFGAFVGQTGPKAVGAEAIAVSGGPCSQGCPELPFAIQAGCLYDVDGIRCDGDDVGPLYFVGLNNANVDTAGLTGLTPDNASANNVCDVMKRDPGCDDSVATGSEIGTMDGSAWNKACTEGCSAQRYKTGQPGGSNDKTCEAIRMRADANCDGQLDVDADGRPAYRTQIPVVQYPDVAEGACGKNYNGPATIVGWVTVAVVSVRCEDVGDSTNKLPLGHPMTAICDQYYTHFSAGSKCVALQMYCDEVDDEQPLVGCGWYGTSSPQPVLVR